MADMDPEGTVSVARAAEMLGMTIDEAYDLVLRRQIDTVEAPTGRRVVPIAVIEQWEREHRDRATSNVSAGIPPKA